MSLSCRSKQIWENDYVSNHRIAQQKTTTNDSDICTPEVMGNQAPSPTPDEETLEKSPPDSHKSDMEHMEEGSLDTKSDDLQANTTQPDIKAPTTKNDAIGFSASLVTKSEIKELAVESETGTENNPPMPSESPQDTSYIGENASESVHDAVTETGNEESPDTTSKEISNQNSTLTTNENASAVVEVSLESGLQTSNDSEEDNKAATPTSTSSDTQVQETETAIPHTVELVSTKAHLDTLPEV